jgi:hypothetical protein
MNKRALLALGCILGSLAAAAGFADGGGGFFHGLQTAEYPFLKDYPIRNNSMGLMYSGGYGYGVKDHEIRGGFGVGFRDCESETGIAGGYGGVLYGLRGLLGPVNIMVVSWTGLGGIRFVEPASGETAGYLIGTEEVDLEVGIAVLPWFMPVFYAGYQVMGNLGPGRPFQDFLSYSPVVGIRCAFGRFR